MTPEGRQGSLHPEDGGHPPQAPRPRASLPEAFEVALRAYERYLRAERGLGPHTRRAYLGDARSLLEFVGELGCA
ncbi:MAG: site-specific integrase, partial [Kineosporiaceae bacterium]